eukprot:COSAG02_NODE_1590_length_11791_cov_24.350239_2_plen_574_part_00
MMLISTAGSASLNAAAAAAAATTGVHVLHVVAPDGLPAAENPRALSDHDPAAAVGDADGSRSAPFHSVAAARDALREMRPLPPGGVEVHLHGGTHAPFGLNGTTDSGRADAPIVYTAAPGENALVSGGVPIPGKAFKAWSKGTGVLRADLSALGVTRELLGGMQTASMKCVGDCQHDKSELFLDGEAMTLARYPNKNVAGGWEFLKADLGGTFGRISANTGGPWFLMKAGPNATRIAGWADSEQDQHSGWLHGYWSKDWADCYRKLLSTTPVTMNGTAYINVSFEAQTHNDDNVDTHARFYGVNLLSELDQSGEYYISEDELLLYFKPPAGSEPSEWVGPAAPVLSVNTTALINLDNVSHVQLKDLTIAYGRANGVTMSGVTDVRVENCTVFGLGQDGMTLSGQESSVVRSSIQSCGCKGLTTSGGNPAQLKPGNIEIIENTIEKVAQWKRTYQPPIAFSGSGNVYRGNRVGQVPHTCITGAGTNLSFSENVIDTCAFESSDVGAFYTCGQGGRAFWSGRGSKVFNNTFKNIRNTAGTGVQGASVQALVSVWWNAVRTFDVSVLESDLHWRLP